MIRIRRAEGADLNGLAAWDRHITRARLGKTIEDGRVFLAEQEGTFAGWLRYNLFWDSLPFLNMLYVPEEYRGQDVGKALMAFWEEEMVQQGFRDVLTSTAACEDAQHFYYSLGYESVGGFFPPEEGYELILKKHLL